jgi:Signal transduction histidine kinase regulating citrate/malate metabolism
MLLLICDIVNTICQAILFSWASTNIANKDNKLTKIRFSALTLIIFIMITLFSHSSIDATLANFLALLATLFILLLYFRKSILDAFIGFTLAYFIITITSYFPCTFYQYYFSKLNLNISSELMTFIFIYIPVFILYILIYKLRKYFFNVGLFIKSLKHSLIIIQLIAYALIILNVFFFEWMTQNFNPMIKSILYSFIFMFYIFTSIYFAKINDKSVEVELLNASLKEKILELKKLKHDYGSEISGLYGLYQLGNIEKLGEVLKSIIEKNESLNPNISINTQSNPVIASVMNTAVLANIDVIILDDANYDNLSISDNELIKLLSNIIKNSIDVLNNVSNPMIKFRSYSNYNGITLVIINNGPEIPSSIKNKIFEPGFSTKENSNSDRGYGLCIVMDILNKCHGKINLDSNKNWTQFKIEIPYKNI